MVSGSPLGGRGMFEFNERKEEIEGPNPYDPARFWIEQDYADLEVDTVIASIEVRKPRKQEFIRVHPGCEFQSTAQVVEFDEDRQLYLVAPEISGSVVEHSTPVKLYTAVNRVGTVFFWPAKMPRLGARPLAWHQSVHAAAGLAKTHWVRVRANMQRGAYDVQVAKSNLSDPQWPTMSFGDMFRLAFGGRLIDSLDHPVLKRLEGRE